MKHEEIFYRWKQAKRQVDVRAGFSDRVMKRVRLAPSRTSQHVLLWPRLIERINISAWAKIATLAFASLMGLGRVLLTLHLLLSL